MAIVQVKILKGLAPMLTKYTWKEVDLFICMKALTTSGKIKNYRNQIESITSFVKCSKGDFHKQIKSLKIKGMVIIDKGNIYPKPWKKVAELYGIALLQKISLDFEIINYDTKNKQRAIQYLNPYIDNNKKAL